VTPPARYAAQAGKAGGLRGDAVGGDQLLLLVQRVEEPEGVCAEAEHGEDRKQRERSRRACRHAPALPPRARCQHHEREHQAGRGLHADAHRDCGSGCAQIGRSTRRAHAHIRRECERSRQRQHHECVVVGAPRRQLQQHRVQAHEHRGRLRRAPHPARRARREGHRPEARRDRDSLQRPQSAGEAEPRERVGAEREQGAIGRVLEGPSDEREHRVGRRFGGHMGIGVEAVQDPQACKLQVPEHVLGDERWPEQQHHIHRHDRTRDRPAVERVGAEQHGEIARAHHERKRLKARRADPQAEAVQRAV
jgi:hypothetical protein